jgi:hypothetical protein
MRERHREVTFEARNTASRNCEDSLMIEQSCYGGKWLSSRFWPIVPDFAILESART